MITILLVSFVVFLVVGIPIAFAMGLSGVLALCFTATANATPNAIPFHTSAKTHVRMTLPSELSAMLPDAQCLLLIQGPSGRPAGLPEEGG